MDRLSGQARSEPKAARRASALLVLLSLLLAGQVLFPSDGARALIRGTAVASPSPYPAMGRLLVPQRDDDRAYACGATLIRPQWILTALHCFTNPAYTGGGIQAVVQFNAPSAVKRIAECEHSQCYHITSVYALDENVDVAVARLDRLVTGITPIDLPEQDQKVKTGDKGIALGYGGGTVLREASGTIRDTHYTSARWWGQQYFMKVDLDGAWSEGGDSGSPFLALDPSGSGKHVAIGVQSQRPWGGHSAYVKTASVAPWISSTISTHEPNEDSVPTPDPIPCNYWCGACECVA